MNKKEPAVLIGKGGRPAFGQYRQPFDVLNLNEYRPYGEKTSKNNRAGLLGRYRFKKWQFIGISNQEIAIAAAIVDSGFAAKTFGYIYNRKNPDIYEFSIMSPFSKGLKSIGSSNEGEFIFESGGVIVRMIDKSDSTALEMSIKNVLAADINIKKIKEPLCLVTRTGYKGFTYTHKEAGNSAEGKVHYKGREWRLDPKDSYAVYDFSTGYMPREVYWNWASGAGMDRGGRRIGFNFACGINETSFTENSFWVDGKLHRYNAVDFQYNDLDLYDPWGVVSSDRRVDLTFVPDGIHSYDLDLGPISSHMYQCFGVYNGKVKTDDKAHELKGIFGFSEDNFARW